MIKKAVLHITILCYLIIAFLAILFALTRIRPPSMLWPVVRYEYEMIAPFQKYGTSHSHLAAQVYINGTWVSIDLEPYLPFSRAERFIRAKLYSVKSIVGREAKNQLHAQMLEKLQHQEKLHGRTYEKMQLIVEQWPTSPDSFTFFRHKPFLTRTVVAEL